jgi:hypothetical protein
LRQPRDGAASRLDVRLAIACNPLQLDQCLRITEDQRQLQPMFPDIRLVAFQ